MPLFSIPSKYGIGTMSKEAYEFVDFLEECGQTYWQILPLGQTSYGDSPYQSFSTFASNPYFIDLEMFIEKGVLTREECEGLSATVNPEYIEYDKVYSTRYELLKLAYSRMNVKNQKEYKKFIEENKKWLDDYTLFMAIKEKLGGVSWQEWPKELKLRKKKALAEMRAELAEEIDFYIFMQYIFAGQWNALKTYANDKGIKIIGDIPIYVAEDSADAWANPELFELDENSSPIAVAGCPPDAFATTGQLWGNPLYNWAKHKETGYAWWIERMEQCGKLCDMVRIDHFRGFDEYYTIPAGDETAEYGKWEKGPGIDLFNALKPTTEKLEIIAEDLGFITDSVIELVKETGFPNMKVIQFGFEPYGDSVDLPHNYHKNAVVYTGTHDNETILGWYRNQNKETKAFVHEYLDVSVSKLSEEKAEIKVAKKIVRAAMLSAADICIIPMQDYLLLDNSARINTPSTLGENWKWRMKEGAIDDALVKYIKKLVKISAR